MELQVSHRNFWQNDQGPLRAAAVTLELVSWYLQPSQPQSGLKTNFNLSPSYSAHK